MLVKVVGDDCLSALAHVDVLDSLLAGLMQACQRL
jgi:hypothetical protein